MMMLRLARTTATSLLLILALNGCGGGGTSAASGGGGTSTTPPPPTPVTVSGVAGKGLLLNAIINFYAVSGGAASTTSLATVRTDATTGAFTSPITSTGPVLVTLTVDSSTQMLDELSGVAGAAPTGLVLHAAIDSLTNLQPIAVTPLTEMAYDIANGASGGLAVANIDAADAAVGTAFLGGAPVLNTQPIDISKYSTATAAQQELAKVLVALAVAANQGTATGSSGSACTAAAEPTYGGRLVCMIGGLGGLLTVNSSGQGTLAAASNYLTDAYAEIDSGAVTVDGGKAPSVLGLNVATQAETAFQTAVTSQAPLVGYNSAAAPLPNTKAFFADIRTNILGSTATQNLGLSTTADAIAADVRNNVGPALGNSEAALIAVKVASVMITNSASAISAGSTASLLGPAGIAVAPNGGLYVGTDTTAVTVNASGVVSLLAGSVGQIGTSVGQGAGALFNDVTAMTVDTHGNIYVTDEYNNSIRRITPAGQVTTIAGGANGVRTPGDLSPSTVGFKDGPGINALFSSPDGIVFDPVSGNLFVSDSSNHAIRMVALNDPNYTVTTIAGGGGINTGSTATTANGTAGFEDGSGASALFFFPEGIAVDSSGNLYVADFYNGAIREVAASTHTVTTLAGGGGGSTTNKFIGTSGYANGPTLTALFSGPWSVALDSHGNVFVGELDNAVVREISGGMVSLYAGTAPTGASTAPVAVSGDAEGAPGVATFDFPVGLAVDGSGTLYVADFFNNAIRKVDLSGNVTTFARSTTAYRNDSTVYCGYDPSVLNTPTNAAQCFYGGYGNPMLMTVTQTATGTYDVKTQPLTGTLDTSESANQVLFGMTPSSSLAALDAAFTAITGTGGAETDTFTGPFYVTQAGGHLTANLNLAAASGFNATTATGTVIPSGTLSAGAGGLSFTGATIGSDSSITIKNLSTYNHALGEGLGAVLAQTVPPSIQGTLDLSSVTTNAFAYAGKIVIGAPVADLSGKLYLPATLTVSGSVAQIGTGGAQTPVFSGSVALSAQGIGAYNATLPISSTNFLTLQVQVAGNLTSPTGRLLSIMATVNGTEVLPVPSTAPDSVTVTYTYTTPSGTAMVNATAQYDSVNGYSGTLTNNGGVKVTIAIPVGGSLSGTVTDNGTETATIAPSGTLGPTINYTDGTVSSLF
ncbi:MAG: hypothetical protein WDM77_11330 [Steroidobacteraceae bacterium]